MCRRLLVHVEDTDLSQEVVRQAIRIASRTHAVVRYLYLEIHQAGGRAAGGFVGTPDEWLHAAREVGNVTLRRARMATLESGVLSDGVYSGDACIDALEAIRTAAEAWRADLVVMADCDIAFDARTRLVARGRRDTSGLPLDVLLVHLVGRQTEQRADERPGVGVRFADFSDLQAQGRHAAHAVQHPHPAREGHLDVAGV